MDTCTCTQPRCRRERERERERDFGESVHKVRICPTRHVHQQGGIEKLAGNPDGLSRSNPTSVAVFSSLSFVSLSLFDPFIYPLITDNYC